MGKEAGAAGERVPAPGNDYFERENHARTNQMVTPRAGGPGGAA